MKLEMVMGNILERLYCLFYKYWFDLIIFRARYWLDFYLYIDKIEIFGFGRCFLNLKGRNSILFKKNAWLRCRYGFWIRDPVY